MKWICRLGVALVVSLAPAVSAQTLRLEDDTSLAEDHDLSEAAADLFSGGLLSQEPATPSDAAAATQEPVPSAEASVPASPATPPADPPAIPPSVQDPNVLDPAPQANSVIAVPQVPQRDSAQQVFHGAVVGTGQQAFAGRQARTWHLLNSVQAPQASLDMWNGYAEEAARCRSHELKHVNGQCGCECLSGGYGQYGNHQQGVTGYAFGDPEQRPGISQPAESVAKRKTPQMPTRLTKQPAPGNSPIANSQVPQQRAIQVGMPERRNSMASAPPAAPPAIDRRVTGQPQLPAPSVPESRVAQPFPQLPNYPGNFSRR